MSLLLLFKAPPTPPPGLPEWPETVPYEVTDGWQMPEMFMAPLASDIDSGNQRLRQQPGNNVAKVTYPLAPMTLTEWADFSTFIRVDCSRGASRWKMPVMTGVDYETKTVQLDGGKSPSATRNAGFVNVTLPLRVYGL